MVAEPTFLVGAEQSGSTLLRLMLDSHPEVAFAEQIDCLIEAIGADGSLPSLSDFKIHLTNYPAFVHSGFDLDESVDFAEAVNRFLQGRQISKGASTVGATVHRHFVRALTLWPEARFIHLLRDPRDVGPARMAEGLAGNIWHALDRWVQTEDEWATLSRIVPADRLMTVRFEDLISDHDSTLTSVCRFLGVDYTSQMLRYTQDTDYQEPCHRLAGDWRDTLTEREVRLAEARVGRRLTEAGFQPSGLPPLTVTDRDLRRLQRTDRVGRAVRRVGSYGVRLTVADIAARRVGTESMQESLRVQFEQVEEASRKKSWSDAEYRTSR